MDWLERAGLVFVVALAIGLLVIIYQLLTGVYHI
jgi:hypothetical protein